MVKPMRASPFQPTSASAAAWRGSRLAYFMRQFLQLFRKWQRYRLAVLRILLIQSFGWDVDYAQVRKVYETEPGTGCSASLLARAC
jgi:hypothetical protein